MSKQNCVGVILAGGSGDRLKSVTHDKILLRIGAGAVISWSVRVFQLSRLFSEIIIAYRDEDQKQAIQEVLAVEVPDPIQVKYVQGGTLRQDSVLNALGVVERDDAVVFIHDGARPFITVEDLECLKAAVGPNCGAAIGRPITDTIKRADKSGSPKTLELEDLDRGRLYAMATPQVFDLKLIRIAYQKLTLDHEKVTDCVAAFQKYGFGGVTLVPSVQNNLKITHPEDVALANYLVHVGAVKKVFELAYS